MIRGLLKGITIFLLSISLLVFGISWTLSSSLTYDHVESNAVNTAILLLNSQINLTQQVDNNLPLLDQYCSQNPSQSSISLSYQGLNFTVSCKDANKSPSQIVNETLKNIINQTYYASYNCNYWDCFSPSHNTLPLFLISEKSQEYWSRVFYYSIASSVLLIAAFILLSKKRESSSLPIGIIAAASALPLLAIQKIIATLPGMISGISAIFFSQAGYVFIRMIITSGVLIAAGIIVKVIKGGSKVYNSISKKPEKQPPKEER